MLFGAGGNFLTGGYTMGSYCGRVRQFLAVSYVDFQRLPAEGAPSNEHIASSATAPLKGLPQPPGFAGVGAIAGGLANGNKAARPWAAVSPPVYQPAQAGMVADNRPNSSAHVQTPQSSPVAQVAPVGASAPRGPSRDVADVIKTVLAVVGIIAILFHGLRLVGSAVG